VRIEDFQSHPLARNKAMARRHVDRMGPLDRPAELFDSLADIRLHTFLRRPTSDIRCFAEVAGGDQVGRIVILCEPWHRLSWSLAKLTGQPWLRRRVTIGLNKGEAKNALSRAVWLGSTRSARTHTVDPSMGHRKRHPQTSALRRGHACERVRDVCLRR
jgi:hypothetical protein